MSFWHEPYVTWKEFEEREKRVYERILTNRLWRTLAQAKQQVKEAVGAHI